MQGLDSGTLSLISPPADIRPGFLPVFRSGSFADIGPKSYMEDEHVCVDNLVEHLGLRLPGIPAPGAFYGVSWNCIGIRTKCGLTAFVKYLTMSTLYGSMICSFVSGNNVAMIASRLTSYSDWRCMMVEMIEVKRNRLHMGNDKCLFNQKREKHR